ncbi:MAG: T9SS type A sorting domain-containing protein [Pedobacter sp.]|nr:MAG: T9SS type A sorting domain-containing protein [Pedobacter sp.]
MIYTNEDSSPWTTNGTKTVNEASADLHFNWQKPEVWKRYKSLIVIGITGINFSSNLIGYARYHRNELGMGTFIIKGFLNASESLWIAAHEMGHVLGAEHDGRDDGSSIMQPIYSTTNWSIRSKQAINAMLDNLDQKKLLYECSEIVLSYELEKDSIALEWQTNYDDLEDRFIIEFSSDEQKNWTELSQKASKGVFTYQYRFISQAPLSAVTYYRIRQQGFNEIISNSVSVSITATENLTENIKVFPNPFLNRIHIQLLAPDNISIYNITGKHVLNTADKQSQYTIDTSAWPEGIYFIQAKSSQKVYKVIK